MGSLKIVSIALIVLGAIINFLVPLAIKKSALPEESAMKAIYIVKSAGLIFVIIGCVMIFWLGGKFGV